MGPLAHGHLLSRYGGEEFLIALPLTDLDGASTWAVRILETIQSQPFTTQIGPVQVKVSLGIAKYKNTHDTIENLIGQADTALFKAKANGRDRVEITSISGPAD